MDDERSLCEIFAKWLLAVGCGVVLTANDGQAALAILQTESVDLLISDVRMPMMDGVALVRSLAGLGKSLPSIVFVSGFGDVDNRERYGLGVEAFVSKPFDRDELLLVLERALAARSTLWQTPMRIPPRQQMVINPADGSTGDAESLLLGRGGFSTRYDQPLRLGKVDFQCCFRSSEVELRGQGFVRWQSEARGTVGVEFAYLEEPCRSSILAEMAGNVSHSFIPEL